MCLFIDYCSDSFRPQFLAFFRELLAFFDVFSCCVGFLCSNLQVSLKLYLELKC